MLKLKKIISAALIIFAVFFTVSFFIIFFFGKNIVLNQIKQNLKIEAKLERISLSLPLTVTLKNLEIGHIFQAERIKASPNLLGLFAGKIILTGVVLTDPVINLEQSADGKLNLPAFEQKGKPMQVFITSLQVKNGKFIFTDKKIKHKGLTVILNQVNIKVSKVMLPPTSLKTKFSLSAYINKPDNSAIGTLNSSGWVDFEKNNMDAVFSLNGFDPAYFEPYFGDFISKKRIVSAKLDFKADIKSVSNDLTAKCNLNLSNLIYDASSQQESELIPVADVLRSTLDIFMDKNGNLNLDFEIKTKFDKPEISPEQLRKIILKAAAKNLADQNPQELADKVVKMIDQFKDIGKQFKDTF